MAWFPGSFAIRCFINPFQQVYFHEDIKAQEGDQIT